MSSFLDRFRGQKPPDLSEIPQGLVVRKLADYSEGAHSRITRYDPNTGQKYIADAATGEPRPWPLLGVVIEGGVPKSVNLPTGFVNRARRDGWLTIENERVEHRPGGPPDDPWAQTHTFHQGDFITIHTVDGPVKYKVVHQPDKYVEGGQVRVDWFYLGERVS